MSAMTCPKCGADMVRRVARNGFNAGGEFWGCTNFPGCKGTRPGDAAPDNTPKMSDQAALAFYERLNRVRSEVEQIQLRTPGRPLDQRIRDANRELDQIERDLGRLAGPQRLPLQQFLRLVRNALDDARGSTQATPVKLPPPLRYDDQF